MKLLRRGIGENARLTALTPSRGVQLEKRLKERVERLECCGFVVHFAEALGAAAVVAELFAGVRGEQAVKVTLERQYGTRFLIFDVVAPSVTQRHREQRRGR